MEAPVFNGLLQTNPTTTKETRGFRVKRILPYFKTLKAAAEPGPDDPDNDPESSIELARQPAVPKYRDPLIGVLDFIAEQCPYQEIAIAHEDDLKLVRGGDVLTADAVESFLRRNEIPVRTVHGAALLAGEDKVVSEDQRVTFFAQANASVRVPLTRSGEHAADCFSPNGEPISLIVHPVLMEYLLKLDIASQPPDYDFGLPPEDLISPAVHPPVLTLILEHKQGYPQNIEVQALDKGSGVGVTVKDVLKTVGANLRLSSSHREWLGLNDDTRREVEAAFEDRARTEEERSCGLRRIDYLRGKNRLQIFPKLPLADYGITHPLPRHPDLPTCTIGSTLQ
ncbi:hypothetical protein EDB83DRAFT_2549694 [Lactarius deliciosus]|nr:hypothetical protein EDB83DRAFT_2549694 [Lactarius deliciosus]